MPINLHRLMDLATACRGVPDLQRWHTDEILAELRDVVGQVEPDHLAGAPRLRYAVCHSHFLLDFEAWRAIADELDAIVARCADDADDVTPPPPADDGRPYRPVTWWRQNTIVQPSRLWHSAQPNRKRNRVRRKKIGGGWFYSEPDGRRHWPDDMHPPG